MTRDLSDMFNLKKPKKKNRIYQLYPRNCEVDGCASKGTYSLRKGQITVLRLCENCLPEEIKKMIKEKEEHQNERNGIKQS